MQAVDLVRQIYAAHAAGDGDSVNSLCADDITFEWAADSQHSKYAGSGKGKAAFLERLGALGEDFEYQSLEVVDVIATENGRGADRTEHDTPLDRTRLRHPRRGFLDDPGWQGRRLHRVLRQRIGRLRAGVILA
jgi:ketosteroid isomerase-like protein